MTAITVTDLNNAKIDTDTIASVATSQANTVTDRLGNTKRTVFSISEAMLNTVAAVQASVGYLPPVAYAAGLNMTVAAQTVNYSGQAYAAILSALPFTTSGTFEATKFRLIQGVVGSDLSTAVNDLENRKLSKIANLSDLSNKAGALNNLGIVNASREVTINASLTIDGFFPASYVINDSASPASYNIFFPTGVALGSIVFFRVDQNATKLFTLYDSGTPMDGTDRRVMWAGESCMLLKIATGWTKVGGQSIAFAGRLKRTADQSITSGVFTNIIWTAADGDHKGLNHCYNPAGQNFQAPRASTYKFNATFCVQNMTPGTQTDAALNDGITNGLNASPNCISTSLANASLVRNSHSINVIRPCFRTETIGAVVRATGTPKVEYVNGAVEVSLYYQEIITW